MKGKIVSPEVRNHIMKSFLDDGVPVAKLAKEYNLNVNTIYHWVKKLNISDSGDLDKHKLILENSRLKREKQELVELIGRLTIDVDKLNKKKDKLL